MDPPANWAQVYRTPLHQNSTTYRKIKTYPGQMDLPTNGARSVQSPTDTTTVLAIEKLQDISRADGPGPSANWAQVYRALLHQNIITYVEIETYLGQTDPTIWAKVYRTLWHHNSISCWEIETYPGQTDPPNRAQVYRALLHQDSISYVRNCDIPRADRPLC